MAISNNANFSQTAVFVDASGGELMKQADSGRDTVLRNTLERLQGQRLCTEELPGRQRLEWLKEVIGREYANVDITPPTDMPLYNDMSIYPWQDGIRLSPIQSNAITLERLPKEPDRITQDCYFAVLLTRGQYKLEQGGREVFLKPGEISLYDATEPHRITIPGQFSKILISIPRKTLDARVTNLGALTATRLPKTGIASIAASFIQSTVNQLPYTDAEEFQSLALPVIDMLTMSYKAMQGSVTPLSHHRYYALLRVKRFVTRNITDTTLDTQTISKAVGLSARYINQLFNEENTSLMRFVSEQRLILSRQLLSSRLYEQSTITELAMQAGFSNVSHFSRVFHQTYGLSPREFRHKHTRII